MLFHSKQIFNTHITAVFAQWLVFVLTVHIAGIASFSMFVGRFECFRCSCSHSACAAHVMWTCSWWLMRLNSNVCCCTSSYISNRLSYSASPACGGVAFKKYICMSSCGFLCVYFESVIKWREHLIVFSLLSLSEDWLGGSAAMAAPVNIQAPSKTWELSLYELHRSPQVKLCVPSNSLQNRGSVLGNCEEIICDVCWRVNEFVSFVPRAEI